MVEKRRRGRKPAAPPPPPEAVVQVPDSPEPDPAPLSESQLARSRLRERWELASVLNFIHVFKGLVGSDLKIPAEEIETGLVEPNGNLAQLHISLLKGIPPAVKNLMDNDAWVTVVCKKLATWWPWVAEGETPLKVDHGEEIARYRELDPTTRLLMLKALCEVRALQDDISRHITDAMKNGTPITAFRKERIGGDDDGCIFWYDGDSVIGYRLYREIMRVESKQKLKGKGHLAQPTDSRWETLATNLEEFQKISDNLLNSKTISEAAVGEIVKTDIIPVLEELQKKKERALKRQQTQTLLLAGFLNPSGIGPRQSRRDRKPVKYTFDDYDQTIEEAIEISKKSKTSGSFKNSDKTIEKVAGHQDTVLSGSMDSDKENSIPAEDHGTRQAEVKDDGKNGGCMSEDDDDDYNDKDDNSGSNGDEDEENDHLGSSDEEEQSRSAQAARGQKDVKAKKVVALRSRRAGATTKHAEVKGHADMKKRLRQRPTRNEYSNQILSDSDDSSFEAKKQTVVLDSESEPSGSTTASDELPGGSGDAGSDGTSDDE